MVELRPVFCDCGESGLFADFEMHGNNLSLSILYVSNQLTLSAPKGFKECLPALSSLTIFYDPLELAREDLIRHIKMLCSKQPSASDQDFRLWELPTVYGGISGPDLVEVASHVSMSEEDAVKLHSATTYQVFMLGFLPGFAYLGGLPDKLRLPRRATPRANVPAGSVAIASDMTAIYPLESPGGWHLVGSTPVPLWDMSRRDEPLLKPGDFVRFTPIDEREAAALKIKAADGWLPEPGKAP